MKGFYKPLGHLLVYWQLILIGLKDSSVAFLYVYYMQEAERDDLGGQVVIFVAVASVAP